MATVSGRARECLLDFACFVWRGYQQAAHLRLLASKLEAIERGEIDRLMIFLPPRHGKSLLASILFPAWFIGRNPDKRVMVTAYAMSLAGRFSRQIRNLIAGRLYQVVFGGVTLAQDSRARQQWNIESRHGGLLAAGVGGGITGEGCDVLLIDDPVKTDKEARSAVYREAVYQWYLNDALPRLEPDGAVILIMTRRHLDDLAGRLLADAKETGEKWVVVKLAAIATGKDSLGRKKGEALWQARWPRTVLDRIRRALDKAKGTRAFDALYQQEPTAVEGELIKREWIRYYDHSPPATCRAAAGIDTATSTKAAAHLSAMCEVLRDPDGYLLVDKLTADKLSVRTLAEMVSTRHRVRKFNRVLVESNNAGEAIRQRMVEIGQESGAYPPVAGETAIQDKTARLMPWTPLIEAGVLKFNRNDPGVVELVEHLCTFQPGDDYDDVDAFVWAVKAAQVGEIAEAGSDSYDETGELVGTRGASPYHSTRRRVLG